MADRESCVAALKNVLNETEGIKFVTREFKGIDELAVTQFPAILIEDDGEEEIEYKTGDWANITCENCHELAEKSISGFLS